MEILREIVKEQMLELEKKVKLCKIIDPTIYNHFNKEDYFRWEFQINTPSYEHPNLAIPDRPVGWWNNLVRSYKWHQSTYKAVEELYQTAKILKKELKNAKKRKSVNNESCITLTDRRYSEGYPRVKLYISIEKLTQIEKEKEK